MKTTIFLLTAVSVAALTAYAVTTKNLWQKAEQTFERIERYFEPADAEEKEVLAPNDHFWISRTLPNQMPDDAAYKAAMNDAQAQMLNANRGMLAFQGFDRTWTTEGPNNIGGRVNSLAVHPTNENIIYAGFERGGVFKTTNGGTSWLPIFDTQTTLSGADICIDPNNANTVYVATGDPCIPFTTFTGNGVYKSTNAGTSWTNIGLTDCGVISRVQVAKNLPNTIYAAAMGKPFTRDANRGLYKTTNGGTTWTKVLYINDETGITDMVVNPTNPQEIYAASWTCHRSYLENKRFSTECKILKSSNGGTTWTVLQGGLPVGEVRSRIGLAMCATQPNVLYATYCDDTYQLSDFFKTTDGGTTWTTPAMTGIEPNIFGGFGWYFGQVRINPTNPNEVTLLGVDMYSSTDGGDNWFTSTPPWYTYEVHADKHAMVYSNTGKIILGTDGGIYKTDAITDNSNGNTWTDIDNIPCTQFYHVAHNPHNPTMYHGGAQDNGSTTGNAATINSWSRDYGGDGFQTLFHPTDANIIYYETQNGNVVCNGLGGVYMPNGSAIGERTNWNTPYMLSPHNPSTVYYGSQSLHKSTDGGITLSAISGDLTGNVTWLPSTHTITSIDESRITQGKIFAGTGNGFLWRTLNGGITWDSIHQNGLPKRYLTCVITSPTNTNRLFVSFSGYKMNDNTPLIYRSDNNGNTWTSIKANLPNFVINDIFVMPNRNDQIIFIGTDAGVYGTLNAGASWERLGTNMPLIPVNDIEYNPTLNTLIAGTYARSIMSYPMAAVLPTTTAETSLLKINTFPNPTTNILNFTLSANDLLGATLDVWDIKGRKVITKPTIETTSIDVAELPKGIYILNIQLKNGKKVSEKWVKM